MTIDFHPPFDQEPEDDDKNVLIGALVFLLFLAFLGWYAAEHDNEILRTALSSQTHTQVPR
jgi:hypothetical protein